MSVVVVPYFMGEPIAGLDVPDPHDTIAPALPDEDQQHRMAVLYTHLAEWVAHHDRPIVFAGDCVAPIGVLAGLQHSGVRPTLVFFDAHGDFNTWETSPSGFVGGMPLAMLTGRGEQTIVDGTGLLPVPDERVILVDGRDLDPGEAEAIAASRMTVTSVADVVGHLPPDGALYVHVDADVVDPTEMPAMNYPAADGPSLAQVHRALTMIERTKRVVAFSISSWNPALPGADVAAAAARELAEPFLTAGWSASIDGLAGLDRP
jgi:arginase